MADLLTHVLTAYVLLTVVSWRFDWLTPRWVVVGMGGAFLPDLQKVGLLVDAETVEAALGVPFTYSVTSTLGGVLLLAGAVTLAFPRRWWRRVYGLVVVGGVSHLLLDGMRVWADGRAGQWLYPFLPAYRPPTPNLYVTSNPLIPVVAVACSVAVFLADRYRQGLTSPTGADR